MWVFEGKALKVLESTHFTITQTPGSAHTRPLFEKSGTKNFYFRKTLFCGKIFQTHEMRLAIASQGGGCLLVGV